MSVSVKPAVATPVVFRKLRRLRAAVEHWIRRSSLIVGGLLAP
jgi:hypothetical protein